MSTCETAFTIFGICVIALGIFIWCIKGAKEIDPRDKDF